MHIIFNFKRESKRTNKDMALLSFSEQLRASAPEKPILWLNSIHNLVSWRRVGHLFSRQVTPSLSDKRRGLYRGSCSALRPAFETDLRHIFGAYLCYRNAAINLLYWTNLFTIYLSLSLNNSQINRWRLNANFYR